MSRRPARTPARRRLQRVRWSMTLAFAAVTAAALLTLVALTLHLDDAGRIGDARAALRADRIALADTVRPGADGLELGAFEQEVQQVRPARWGVLSDGVILAAAPDDAALPSDAVLARIAATAAVGRPVELTTGSGAATVLWSGTAVLPGPGADPPPGSVVLLGEPVPRTAEHAALRDGLLAAVLLLVVVAAAGGHLIAGRAMRPALTALEQQEQFLAEAAHELRTPLTTLRLLTEPDAPADRRSAVRTQVDRLDRLVGHLLLRARLDTGRVALERTPLRLDQLVEQVVAEFDGDRGLVEPVLAPAVVTGDPAVLGLAVRNLVENALLHGGGRVLVRVDDQGVEVVDHGPGIPSADRRAVLRPGVSRTGGSGRGLALAEWAVRLHGGALGLGDTAGGGLTARLQLPRSTSSSPHRPARRVVA